jgi:hypothetical protein
MPALWLDDDLKAAKRHVHFEVLRSIPIQATVTTGTDSEKQPLRQTLEEGRLKKQKGNSSWQKSSRPLLGGGVVVCRPQRRPFFSLAEALLTARAVFYCIA